MVRTGSAKKKDEAFANGRLLIARGYLKDARDTNAVADPGDIGNPSMSTVVNCAIAYADALTAKFRGEINQDDHQAVTKLLKAAWASSFLPSRNPICGHSSSRRTRSSMAQGQRRGGMPRELWSDSKNSSNGLKNSTLSNTLCPCRTTCAVGWSA